MIFVHNVQLMHHSSNEGLNSYRWTVGAGNAVAPHAEGWNTVHYPGLRFIKLYYLRSQNSYYDENYT